MNIFKDTQVAWFPVPKAFVKMMPTLSNRAVRLYLVLLSTANTQKSETFFLAAEDEVKYAELLPRDRVKTRRELVNAQLITEPIREERGHRYTILQPDGQPLPSMNKVKRSEVKHTNFADGEIVALLKHLPADVCAPLFDSDYMKNGNKTLRYFCPFHTQVGSRGKRKWLTVDAYTGLWRCTEPSCKHHGKRRISHRVWSDGSEFDPEGLHPAPTWEEIKMGAAPLHDVYHGGGNFLDLIVALHVSDKNESPRYLDRTKASRELAQVWKSIS